MASIDECAVKIAVRERPLRVNYEDDKTRSAISYHSSNSNILVVGDRSFLFDHVFRPENSQCEVFLSLVRPLVDKALDGFNCTALAYGQTGTGKSFSMGLNQESFEGDHVGVIPRCLDEIFQAADVEDSGKEISASFIEIYNEKVYDLLGDEPNDVVSVKGCKFAGGTKLKILNIQEGYGVLTRGNKNRHVRPTKMNTESSRSHAIFTIHISRPNGDGLSTSSLNLVDLAGSEGVRKTGHQGAALTEGVHINQGLLSIGKVLQALTSGNKMIPYRDSVLSSVLQDSLNSNSFLSLLACISPHRKDLSETLSTLRFAQNAKKLKHTPQIQNMILEVKKNRIRTPIKANPMRHKTMNTPLPRKTPLKLSNAAVPPSSMRKSTYPLHSNTFCTPGKVRKIETNKKLNHTEMGLTTLEKMRLANRRTTVENLHPTSRYSVRQSTNDTLDSRVSIMSMNMSTSTAIGTPVTASYSPVVRKCVAEVEEKLMKIVESIKSSIQLVPAPPSENDDVKTPFVVRAADSTNNLPLDTLRQELRTMVREELRFLSDTTTSAEGLASEPAVDLDNLRCALFQEEDSKIPAENISSTENSISTESNSYQEEDSLGKHFEQTIIPAARRRSKRLSSLRNSSESIVKDEINDEYLEQTVMPAVRRRSRRLSASTTEPARRSLRLSVAMAKSSKRALCRSLPKSADLPTVEETEEPEVAPRKRKTARNAAPVNNTIIAGYFKTTTNTKSSDKITKETTKNAKAKHKKAVLDLLNSGSIKELQVLPQVGLKTAYQLITHRTLNGKFKSLDQVAKVPVWRGKAWERFKQGNSID